MTITVATEAAQKSFYPTPATLAEKLLEGFEMDYANSVLEPSAGTGSLIYAFADKLYEKYYQEKFCNRCVLNVDCCEIDPALRGILTENFSEKARSAVQQEVNNLRNAEREYWNLPAYAQIRKKETLLDKTKMRIVHDDFLSYETYKPYDLIIMNPPFANGDAHLLKAIAMQERTGGEVRCILNAETIRNPYTKRRQELLRKLTEHNADISFVENAFSDAPRSAEVDAAIIKLDIPKPVRESDLFKNCLKAEIQRQAEEPTPTELAFSDTVKRTIAEYRAEIAAGVKLINEYIALKPYIMATVKVDQYTKPMIKLAVGGDQASDTPSVESYCKEVRSKYWNALFMNPEFQQQLTKSLRDEISSRVRDMADLEFSEYNIRTLMTEMNVRMAAGIEDSIMELFDKLTVKHSYHRDIESGNVHYFTGWCTNQAYKVGKKVIIPWYGNVFGYWDDRKNIDAYAATSALSDIEKALNYLDGNLSAQIDLYGALSMAEKTGQTRKIQTKYFYATFYKKGTMHLEFTCPDLIERFNLFCAQKRGWLPPSYGRKKYHDMDAEEKTVIDSFHGDGAPGSGEKSYSDVLSRADYFLSPVYQTALALPDGTN